MTDKQRTPFGTWPSPISPIVTAQRTRLQDVQWSKDGQTLVWLEGRSAKGVLVASDLKEAPRDLTAAHSVRGRVGYGGGDFAVTASGVFYANLPDGRLYQQPLQHGAAKPITPGFGASATPTPSPDGRKLLFVHTYEDVDNIGMLDLDAQRWPTQLVSGADFYMSPCWHPDGQHIAWIEWDHPNMPWDHTRLKLAQLSDDGHSLDRTSITSLALEGEPNAAITQPAFSPDGRYLSYLTTYQGLEAMVLYDLQNKNSKVAMSGAIFSTPAWAQGLRTYGWNHDGTSIFYRTNERGKARLWRYELASASATEIDLGPYTWFDQLAVSPTQDRLAMFASSSQVPTRLITWHDQQIQILRRSIPETLSPEAHPTPRAIHWDAPDGSPVHGIYYPPTNPNATDEGLPPAILNVHGGPTSQSVMSYSSDTAFFTSRGFAVLEVNYRGSTGYGKAYMDALRGQWGIYDVEDVVGAAKALGEQGLADPERLVLKGGSAGGYTVLRAFTQAPGVFKAGVCLFGISNLFTLAASTHKFEARYLDSLIGPLPQESTRYRERSPIFSANNISDPIAVFQGDEDRVVPPDQSEAIVQALRANGVPHIYELYAGEGHGWRKTETIASYYESVLQFLQQYVLFS